MDKLYGPDKTKRKAAASIIAIMVQFFMLVLTTYALIASFVSVEGNLFETGTVKIELNGGKTVFDGSDMNIEPGHSLVRDFTVENKGTADIHYRLYLENVAGSLQEVLTFEIYDGGTLLFSGAADEMTEESPCISATTLDAGESRTLTAVVKMDEAAGSTYQQGSISFDMTADAVQAKNNPDKSFK